MKLIITYKILKKVIMFGYIKIKKHNFHRYKCLIFSEDVDTDRHYCLTTFLLMKKAVNTLLVTCMMIIKLSHHV